MSAVDLLSVAPAERISDFLGHGVSPDLVGRIIDVPALRRHMTRLLDARLQSDADDPKGNTVLALDMEGVSRLATRAGIVWHASMIAAVIDATSRRKLIEEIGEDHYRLALAARAEKITTPSPDVPLESMRAASDREGMGCITAWRDVQPRRLADRLRLYWPNIATTEAHRTIGPAIVDWLLERPIG